VEDLEADPRALLAQAQRTGRPLVIAEAGKPAVVLLTAERYEWLVHLVNFARLINEGEESIRKEGTRPLEDFIRDMEAKHGYAFRNCIVRACPSTFTFASCPPSPSGSSDQRAVSVSAAM
jgi:prevent-host-death family protein